MGLNLINFFLYLLKIILFVYLYYISNKFKNTLYLVFFMFFIMKPNIKNVYFFLFDSTWVSNRAIVFEYFLK